jgi:hypothetical protein
MPSDHAIKPAISVAGPVIEAGIIASATVLAGGRLTLSGICQGELVVEKDGLLILSGLALGRVLCKGGTVQINGIAEQVFAQSGSVVITGIVNRLHRALALVTVDTRAIVRSDA